jgi:hypothetical protein
MDQPGLEDLTDDQIAAFPFGQPIKYTYLGDKHWYALTTCNNGPNGCPGEGPYHGAIVPHIKAEGTWCAGAITFAPHTGQKATWSVECWEPLTLSPSLLCGCGDHGFIREGKWVRA